MWLIFGLLLIGTGLFYLMGFILRCFNSVWLDSKMKSFFPLLGYKFPEKKSQLLQLAFWSIFLPTIGILILFHIQWALIILMCLGIWEVYLGTTFYFSIGDTKGACLHMILHTFIATTMLSYFLQRFW